MVVVEIIGATTDDDKAVERRRGQIGGRSHNNQIEATCSKGAPICPFTAYEGAQTLSIHPIWMWDAVSGGLQPQP